MADAQPGVAALFDVDLRAAESPDQEIAQALLRTFEIVRRVHGPKDVVGRNLAVKGGDQSLESGLAHGGENVLLFHSNRS